MSIARMGKSPWNKGLKSCFSEDTIKKMSESHKGMNNSPKTQFKKGKNHRDWIGGCSNYYHKEARKKVEKVMGEKLTKDIVVHHIDGNPRNNSNNNLLVCTREYHSKLHYKQGDIKW